MIFALGKGCFQRCVWWNFRFIRSFVGNFHTIRPWTFVGTLYLDDSYVNFKYFAFLSVCDKFELLGNVHAAMMIWVCFCCPSWIHCWLLLADLSDYFGHLVTSTFLLCKFRAVPRSSPASFPIMMPLKCLGIKRSSQPSSTTTGKRAEKTCRRRSRREANNAKSRKSLFHFQPEKVNKFEYWNNLWKPNIFHNPVRKLGAWL